MLRREGGHALEVQRVALGQRVPDPDAAMGRDADDVARPGFLGHLAFLREEEQRRVDRHLLARAHLLQPHPLLEPARADAQEGDAVAVLRVHVRLDLEHEAGELRLLGPHRADIGRAGPRRRGEAGEAFQQVRHAEIPQRRAEIDRRERAFEELFLVEGRAGAGGQFRLLAQRRRSVARHARSIVGSSRPESGITSSLSTRRSEGCSMVVDAAQVLPLADRPGDRRGIEGERLLDLVQQVEGGPAPPGPSC